MTRLRSSFLVAIFLAGCATSSGVPAPAISQPAIAAAYIPLHRGSVLAHAEGAAMTVAPGIAVTNGHNRNLVNPDAVIGEARDYDLLFFRSANPSLEAGADPHIGDAVSAYGQGVDGELRQAQGSVRAIRDCAGCSVPAYFIFAGNAGPGFSGGPVLDKNGRLVGIIFGYRQEGPERLIYAYPMSRVMAELSGLLKAAN
jgi:hypothetical protein